MKYCHRRSFERRTTLAYLADKHGRCIDHLLRTNDNSIGYAMQWNPQAHEGRVQPSREVLKGAVTNEDYYKRKFPLCDISLTSICIRVSGRTHDLHHCLFWIVKVGPTYEYIVFETRCACKSIKYLQGKGNLLSQYSLFVLLL